EPRRRLSAAPADDRGHDHPPVRREDQGRLHPPGPRVHGFPRTITGRSRARGSPALSAAPGLARRELRPHELGEHGAAVLLSRHACPAGLRQPHGPDRVARAAAGRAEPRGGGAAARPRAEPQVPRRAQRCLWRRPARLGDRQPEGRRYRQRPHADPGRAGQGPQGPLRHALARPPRPPAPVVAGEAPARLAVPW
ncbi:MAG: Site-specific tyrosine recombinase, partial [uncultured Sphingomonas sp.]